MMKNLMFAALSLVSGLSKYKDGDSTSLKGMEIEKNAEYIIEGKYANINHFWGINVTGTETEDYFYTFEKDEASTITKSGKAIAFDEIHEGDRLKVTYDGSVSLVYPPKLNNVTKIEVIDSEPK